MGGHPQMRKPGFQLGIVGQALVPMAIGTALVTSVASWWIYAVTEDRYSTARLREIETLTAERTRIESQVFAAAGTNLKHLKRLVQHYHHDRPVSVGALQVQPDGSQRLSQDGLEVWVAPDAVDDELFPIIAVLEEYGPAWGEQLPAVAVACEGRFLIGWGEPLRELADALLPSDPVLLPQESALLAQPGAALRWSAPYVEPATERWMVTAILPVAATGRRAAAIQHVPLDELLARYAPRDAPVQTVIWQLDGSVLSGDAQLVAELQAQVPRQGPATELIALPDDDHLAVTRLPEPGLLIVTHYPSRVILGPARAAAAFSLLVGGVALLAQILVATVVLRRRVRWPIHRLQERIQLLEAGERDAQAATDGPKEIRSLAEAFNKMVDAVARSEDELKAAFAKLEQRERLYFALFDSAGDAVLLLADGRIEDCNKRAEECFGGRREELVGRSFMDLATSEQEDGVGSDAAFAARTQVDKIGEIFPWRARRLDGAIFDTEILLGHVALPGRELLLVSLRDVTERNLLEEQVRQAQKMESLGQLSGGIAHDFNNMLGAMMGMAELLARRLDGDDADMAGRIVQTGERAAGLTTKLLAFARRGRTMSSPVDVHDLIGDTITLLERSIDRRIKMATDLRASRSMVIADASAIENALLNLGLNARDAMPEGGTLSYSTENLTIAEQPDTDWSQTPGPGPHIRISVRDSGRGMSDEVRVRIFEPFFTTKAVGKGTGLGLAAVYRTIHDHGGALRVTSAVDEGTHFELLLPVAEGSRLHKRQGMDVREGSQHGCVLVVDDEAHLRAMAREMLVLLGFEVVEAANGREGLAVFAANKQRIDAILMDMEMPEMRGIDCMRAIRALDPDASAVLCSGFARDTNSEELRQAGFTSFLQKPFRMHELGKLVGEAVADRRQRRDGGPREA